MILPTTRSTPDPWTTIGVVTVRAIINQPVNTWAIINLSPRRRFPDVSSPSFYESELREK